MSKKHDVVIIGAGAIGCSIAYHLARRGITSTIIEKEYIGARASGKAWAVVSYPHWFIERRIFMRSNRKGVLNLNHQKNTLKVFLDDLG